MCVEEEKMLLEPRAKHSWAGKGGSADLMSTLQYGVLHIIMHFLSAQHALSCCGGGH
jgi:hypothetical protein